ncbi:hypothetical protein GF406_26220, partial [candidate division KSB1 bacterium]|nr:hypothetical protein [candidate division KSB1 bacterium]
LIGQDPAFVKIMKQIELVAQSETTVLIQGETGVGKELCARAIHYNSPSASFPFVPVECGSIPVHHEWPGNVRELDNVIQQAVLLSSRSIISAEDIYIHESENLAFAQATSFNEAKRIAVERFEREYIIRMLEMHNGNITHASQEAQKDRSDFRRLLKKYNINPARYKNQAVSF